MRPLAKFDLNLREGKSGKARAEQPEGAMLRRPFLGMLGRTCEEHPQRLGQRHAIAPTAGALDSSTLDPGCARKPRSVFGAVFGRARSPLHADAHLAHERC